MKNRQIEPINDPPEQRPDEKASGRGLGRLLRAFCWSMAGFAAAFRHEIAFRQELLLCAGLAPLPFLLGNSSVEKALMLGSLFLILLAELLNSAVEAVVDRIGPEMHPLAGRAKDIGSAAVFLSLINAGTIWAIILLEL